MSTGLVRRIGVFLLSAALPLSACPALSAAEPSPPPPNLFGTHFYGERVEYPLVFPVAGDVLFADDDLLGFGSCRAGCTRLHEGVDLLAPKMTEIYAVADATVSWIGSRCCSVFLQHDDGWQSWYIHLNNDTPGTDDGAGWGIAPGIVPGARVTAGQVIGWVGDSGNAEDTSPHLHFELHDAYGVPVDPYPSLVMAQQGLPGICPRTAAVPLGDLLQPGATLRRGMRGAGVYELQGFLATRGYAVGAIDGIFGDQTHKAVRAFQRGRGLEQDGVVGIATRAAIAAIVQRPAFSSLLSLDGRVLEQGMRGAAVGELKRWLRAAGYSPGPRPFDGRFDEATYQALVAFQVAAGLPGTGLLDSAAREAFQRALWLVRPDGC